MAENEKIRRILGTESHDDLHGMVNAAIMEAIDKISEIEESLQPDMDTNTSAPWHYWKAKLVLLSEVKERIK